MIEDFSFKQLIDKFSRIPKYGYPAGIFKKPIYDGLTDKFIGSETYIINSSELT